MNLGTLVGSLGSLLLTMKLISHRLTAKAVLTENPEFDRGFSKAFAPLASVSALPPAVRLDAAPRCTSRRCSYLQFLMSLSPGPQLHPHFFSNEWVRSSHKVLPPLQPGPWIASDWVRVYSPRLNACSDFDFLFGCTSRCNLATTSNSLTHACKKVRWSHLMCSHCL